MAVDQVTLDVSDPSERRMSWSARQYALAWESGAFDGERVELLEGEIVRMVPVAPWHAATTPRLIRSLPDDGVVFYQGTLPSGPSSVPDPDLFVVRAGAQPAVELGQRLVGWNPADVVLVVEVSDSSLRTDLTTKSEVYAAAGYPTYWVVSRDAITVFTDPGPRGYATRGEYLPQEQVPVPYGDLEIDVARLLG